MPIEFRCPSCSKLLRTPDESAGKKAKCPQCGTVVDVPAMSSGPAPEPWSGLPASPFDAAGATPPDKNSPFGDAGVNPYASPSATASAIGGGATEEGARQGLPWDYEQKSVKTYWSTCKIILGSPTLAFSIMAREGGLGSPMVFALIGGAVGGLLAGVYNTLIQLALLTFVQAAGGPNAPPELAAQTWVQVGLQLPMALVGGTVGVVIGTFISSGLYHLFLMMLGGAKQPYETTYRVVAYVTGSTALIQVIPFCGQYIVGLMALIYTIIGLSNAHRIGGGKAAAAVLLPIVVCAVACGIVIAAIFGLAFSQINMN